MGVEWRGTVPSMTYNCSSMSLFYGLLRFGRLASLSGPETLTITDSFAARLSPSVLDRAPSGLVDTTWYDTLQDKSKKLGTEIPVSCACVRVCVSGWGA